MKRKPNNDFLGLAMMVIFMVLIWIGG